MADAADRAKELAARQAVESYVRPGLSLALGTGSTAAHAVRSLAHAFPGEKFDCVASSRATEELARSVGLPVRGLRAGDRFDLMLDGADEIAPSLDLTKGGGGALFREKLLARLSRRLVIVADASKLVPALGTRFPIPVEVVPFARPVLEHEFAEEGFGPRLRRDGSGQVASTDNGNEILDLHLGTPLSEPGRFHEALKRRTGVVETGLFVGLAERAVVADPSGKVREILANPRGGR